MGKHMCLHIQHVTSCKCYKYQSYIHQIVYIYTSAQQRDNKNTNQTLSCLRTHSQAFYQTVFNIRDMKMRTKNSSNVGMFKVKQLKNEAGKGIFSLHFWKAHLICHRYANFKKKLTGYEFWVLVLTLALSLKSIYFHHNI